jgi:alkylation response protein AidB-like acyl-CoA dehydrogenase
MKRSKVLPCLRRSGYAQAGIKFFQHTHPPLVTPLIQLGAEYLGEEKVQFELTDTQKDIQKAAKEFAEKEFELDLALELEKEGRYPKSIFEKACHLGFIGIEYPEQYGGQSFGLFENILVIEEFTRKDSGIGISLSLADMGSSIILKHGDERQKKKVLV